ncbi:cytochrome c [Sphingomonas ginkgonis]|uniref:Cytochrome c n=1 Tax=Sphingomonas ginkgonis TaxID=2315330 RepID=A0A3R9YLE7_9SPHN|nr:cytochrome c [Sphingomonas ginkgonis]RST30440.1 cytochrome c [Sphingomonas ginkgonis]
MKKLLVTAAALALLAACNKGTSTNQAMADANAGAAQASSALNNAVASSDATPLDKARAAAIIKDRHAKYHQIADAMKAAKRGLDASPTDIATVRSSAATIAGLAPQVLTWFPKGTGVDSGNKTGAKAEIWQQADKFAASAKDFNGAAQAFDAAAKGSDLAATKTAFGNLGKSCKACHEQFRAEDHDHD